MGKDNPKRAYNREPLFKGENYAFWKECMFGHLMSLDKIFWVATEIFPFSPKVSSMLLKLINP